MRCVSRPGVRGYDLFDAYYKTILGNAASARTKDRPLHQPSAGRIGRGTDLNWGTGDVGSWAKGAQSHKLTSPLCNVHSAAYWRRSREQADLDGYPLIVIEQSGRGGTQEVMWAN